MSGIQRLTLSSSHREATPAASLKRHGRRATPSPASTGNLWICERSLIGVSANG
jgi:hypothetical protein